MAAVLDFPQAEPRRYNIYTVIHKALRGRMSDTLVKLGQVDVSDACERAAIVAQLRELLHTCMLHLQHEEDVLHPEIHRGTRAEAARHTEHEHSEHIEAMDQLGRHITKLESAPAESAGDVAYALYLELSKFVAENFEHMVHEETENHRALTDRLSDQDIMGLEQRIVASIEPGELAKEMRWMLAYMNAGERAFMLGGMKQFAPPEVFAGTMALAREALSDLDYYKLEKALS